MEIGRGYLCITSALEPPIFEITTLSTYLPALRTGGYHYRLYYTRSYRNLILQLETTTAFYSLLDTTASQSQL